MKLFFITLGLIVSVTIVMFMTLSSPALITMLCPTALALIWLNGFAAKSAGIRMQNPFVIKHTTTKPAKRRQKPETVEFN